MKKLKALPAHGRSLIMLLKKSKLIRAPRRKYKYIVSAFAMVMLALSIAGFSAKDNKPNGYISFYHSSADANKYCNGAVMNSDSYEKTITSLTVTSEKTNGMTREEILNKTIEAVDDNIVVEYFRRNKKKLVTYDKGTATIAPFGGWAGSSIFMCAWQPTVEVNLKAFPSVKHVYWAQIS